MDAIETWGIVRDMKDGKQDIMLRLRTLKDEPAWNKEVAIQGYDTEALAIAAADEANRENRPPEGATPWRAQRVLIPR